MLESSPILANNCRFKESNRAVASTRTGRSWGASLVGDHRVKFIAERPETVWSRKFMGGGSSAVLDDTERSRPGPVGFSTASKDQPPGPMPRPAWSRMAGGGGCDKIMVSSPKGPLGVIQSR